MRKKNTLYLEDLLPYVQETEEYLLEENINEMFHYNDFVKSIGTKENITFDEEKGPKKLEKKPYKPVLTRKLITGNEGYCKVCDKWFKLKNSSYWYHMNFIHGINSEGKKYPEPKIRIGVDKLESFCKACNKWIFLGTKRGAKSYRFTWFKHWQKNHKNF
ncbi:meiotic expression up-regulated 26-like protein [Tubulinosema ratisbonensis]|uniref:Meiotic expression up-regulated 26-like protein n=1 Tax=Tubulinosema ratisbonensis TaxID=291195 RepID=A0A437AMU2_9MICR|nr:meiotic expression up-regulated 26-like protein [Tubulinosema ratisbonensis]